MGRKIYFPALLWQPGWHSWARNVNAFSETVFLSQHAAIKTCWVGVAAWCHMAPRIGSGSVQGTPKKAAFCHSSPRPLPWGQGIWAAASIDRCVACLQGPFDVTCKHPARKRKMQPIIQTRFSMCWLLCECLWLLRWGTDSELFINTFQPAQVGPRQE